MTVRTKGREAGTAPEPGDTGIRLQKVLAAAGVASRREAERMIEAGRVEVNGRIARTLGTRVDPGRDTVRVDGVRIGGEEARVYILLYKPRGFITSTSDPEGRPTVIELLRGVRQRVFPVGRLDWDSEGLLLLTNDGDLAFRLTHPAHHVPRVYRVKVRGMISDESLVAARRGLWLDGRKSQPARVTRISSRTHTWLEMVLHEGRRNQIRRTFERLGHPVLKLRRVAIGPITDRQLKPGQFRRLAPEEIRRLQAGR